MKGFRYILQYYNHQGSVTLVTNMTGRIQQHLQYHPYGGIFVDHRPGSYSSPYTFSAKEKDSESGYNYFGARYYSDGIMQWLSVDPMSDMRPGVSPYSYCQNNPIGRIDPSGALDEGYITGTAAKEATEQLRQAAPNLDIQRDEESGKLSYSGTAITKAEKKIAQAIDDKNVIVNINAENCEKFVYNGETLHTRGGSYLGNSMSRDPEDGSICVNTFQQVNPQGLATIDELTNDIGLMGHEFLESYFGGQIAEKTGVSSPRAGIKGSTYTQAHNLANKYFLGGYREVRGPVPVITPDGQQLPFPTWSREGTIGWEKTK